MDIFEWHHARCVVVPRGKRIGKEETKMSAEEDKAVVRREQEELWNYTATSTQQRNSMQPGRPRLLSRRQQISGKASLT
jgi:hypothetical protein